MGIRRRVNGGSSTGRDAALYTGLTSFTASVASGGPIFGSLAGSLLPAYTGYRMGEIQEDVNVDLFTPMRMYGARHDIFQFSSIILFIVTVAVLAVVGTAAAFWFEKTPEQKAEEKQTLLERGWTE